MLCLSLGFRLSLKQRSELERDCSPGKPNRQLSMAKLPLGEAGQRVGRPLQPPHQPKRPPKAFREPCFPSRGPRPAVAHLSQPSSWQPLLLWTSLVAQRVKHLPAMLETWVWSLGWGDSLQEGMATHSSTLVWKIPWTEAVAGLQSIESLRVGHNWVTKYSTAQKRWKSLVSECLMSWPKTKTKTH